MLDLFDGLRKGCSLLNRLSHPIQIQLGLGGGGGSSLKGEEFLTADSTLPGLSEEMLQPLHSQETNHWVTQERQVWNWIVMHVCMCVRVNVCVCVCVCVCVRERERVSELKTK